MADSSVPETTQLLRAWAVDDQRALEALIPRVYRQLRRLARRCVQNERPEQTLQVSDPVHKAYLYLADLSRLDWQHRNHFLAVPATLISRILVDRARGRMAVKRGDGAHGINVERAQDLVSRRPAEVVARIVERRFFGGLEVKETADLIGVSPDRVVRDWRLAKAWLLKELSAAV